MTMKGIPCGDDSKLDAKIRDIQQISRIIAKWNQIHPEGIPQLSIVNCQLSIVNSKRLPEIHSSLRLCTCQPASTSAFTTPRVLFILWSSSSSGSFRSMVSAEMVTTAVPLVGTMELMVMILAFASA